MLKTIDLSDLPDPLVMAIESLVETYREKTRLLVQPQVRPLGWLKSRLEIPDSFFESLPEDVLDSFNGGSERA